MKLIVAGSRSFSDFKLLRSTLNNYTKGMTTDITLVSGKCPDGADALGEIWAKNRGILIDPHPANWTKYGNAAGPIRNEEMAKIATDCVCFWDGRSRGTKSMISLAQKYQLKLFIINF